MRDKLRTINDFRIYNADWDDPRSREYYHPPTILSYNGNECVIGAGQSDYVHLFKFADGDGSILILVVNDRHGYIGLSWANSNLETGEHVIKFLQSPDDEYTGITDLPKSIMDYTPINQAKILVRYWQ